MYSPTARQYDILRQESDAKKSATERWVMLSSEDIDSLLSRLAIHRRNVALLLKRIGYHGGEATTPISDINSLQENREFIRHIKDTLRNNDVIIDDHPNDERQN